jgi:hypothetical protein
MSWWLWWLWGDVRACSIRNVVSCSSTLEYQNIRMLDYQNIRMSVYQNVRLSEDQNNTMLDYQNVSVSEYQTIRISEGRRQEAEQGAPILAPPPPYAPLCPQGDSPTAQHCGPADIDTVPPDLHGPLAVTTPMYRHIIAPPLGHSAACQTVLPACQRTAAGC